MSFNLQIVGILFLLAIILSLLYILRKGRIAIKYSIVWFFACIVLLIFILFTNIMTSIANLLGFEVGSNMIFAGLIAILCFSNRVLTVIVSGQNAKIRLLIQEVSILKGEIHDKK